MLQYFAVDSNGISWPIDHAFSNEDAAQIAVSMGIDVREVYSRVVEEEEEKHGWEP